MSRNIAAATIATIETELRFHFQQTQAEAAALAGELGVEAQLIAMSEAAKAMRAAGDEAGYQAMRAEAYRIFNSNK
jgi:hypothetical protein